MDPSTTKATYGRAYAIARRYTAGHLNPFFNLIDRALSESDLRTPTAFLWQRSPFLLFGGRAGTTGYAGVDYILPY